MAKKEALTALLDINKVTVLKVLLSSPEELSLKEIVAKSSLPTTSTFHILQQLCQSELVNKRTWKNSKVYHCPDNEKINFLKDLLLEEFDGFQEFVNHVKSLPEVHNLIFQGTKESGKANFFLIGEQIDTNKIDAFSNTIRQKGFDLSYLSLTTNQYAQMMKMGLYAGEKKVLK